MILSSPFLYLLKYKPPPDVFSVIGERFCPSPNHSSQNSGDHLDSSIYNLSEFYLFNIFLKHNLFLLLKRKALALLHFKLLSALTRSRPDTSLSGSKLFSLQSVFHIKVSDFFFHHKLDMGTCLPETIYCNWNQN